MQVLFYCNTYMQVINAIQIKKAFYANAKADFILSDHSVGAKDVVDRLGKTKIFEHVWLCQTKKIQYGQGKLEDILDVFRIAFSVGKKFRNLLWEKNISYDRIVYYNMDMLLYHVFDLNAKSGKESLGIRFEEGLHSYENMISSGGSGRIRAICQLKKIFSKHDFYENLRNFYCYYPEMFPAKPEWNVQQIPTLDRNEVELIQILNTVFNYNPSKSDFHRKYIFFGSSADIDGKNVEEEKLVQKIAMMVGEENLLVKTHPRDNRNIYRDSNIEVMENSNVPWEVIQLNHDFSNHVFLTLGSGSVLTASAMLDDNIPTFYYYPIVREKNETFYRSNEAMIGRTLDKLQKLGKCETHRICYEADIFV